MDYLLGVLADPAAWIALLTLIVIGGRTRDRQPHFHFHPHQQAA